MTLKRVVLLKSIESVFKNQKNVNLAVNLFNIIKNKEEEIAVDRMVKIADALDCSLTDLTRETK